MGDLNDDNGIAVISKEDARTILDNQIKTHHHIQSQAQGTVRIIAAAVAITASIVAIGSSAGVRVNPQISEQGIQQVAANLPVTPQLVGETVILNIVLSLVIFTSSLILLPYSILVLLRLLAPSQLQPGLGANDKYAFLIRDTLDNRTTILNKTDGSIINHRYIEWLEYNRDVLEQEHRQLSVGVIDFITSLVGFSSFFVMLSLTFEVSIFYLVIIDFIIVSFPFVSLLGIIRRTVTIYYEQESRSRREVIKTSYGRYRRNLKHLKHYFPVDGILFVAFYVLSFLFSIWVVWIWVSKFVQILL